MKRAFCLFFAVVLVIGGWAMAEDRRAGSAPPAVPTIEPAANVKSDRFGVNVHMGRDPGGPEVLVPIVARAGFGTVRIGEQWDGIERQKGVYATQPLTDLAINLSCEAGIDPLFLLAYGNPLYKNNLDPEKFADHAIWLMDRFKGKVTSWEIWNEPPNFYFLKQYGGTWNGKEADGSESPWVGKFADFVTVVAARIKAAHPEVKLVTGSASVSDIRLLRNHPAMWKQIDVIAIHPYPYRLPPESQPFGGQKMLDRDGIEYAGPDHSFKSMIAIYRDALAAAGRKDMPIWVTEVGYTTYVSDKPNKLWVGMSEPVQAIYLSRFGILAASLGVEKTLFYCLTDSGDTEAEPEHRFGLTHRDHSPKPSYLALQRLSGLMPGNTRLSKMTARVERPAPIAHKNAAEWDKATLEMLDEPQVHVFERPDGNIVLFFWRSGPVQPQKQDERCNLEIDIAGTPRKVVEAGRVAGGEEISIQSTLKGKLLRLTDVPLGSDALYVVLK